MEPSLDEGDEAAVDLAGEWPVPTFARSRVLVDPPGDGPGHWSGAPSAVRAADGAVYLAYRLRHPVGAGRGYANVIARSDDGERFETVATLHRDDFDCESLERPAIVERPDGGLRVYLSCATPGSKHWRVDALDADRAGGFDASARRTVFAGDAIEALKDPVVRFADGRWQAWVCAHPLERAGDEDRMTTRYATSGDGLDWELGPAALSPTPGSWDARGTRVSEVLVTPGGVVAYYDGRASAEENAEEHTGVALGAGPDRLVATGAPLPGVGFGTGSLRYLSVLAEPAGYRLYYETTRRDGAHDLRTEYVPRPRSPVQS